MNNRLYRVGIPVLTALCVTCAVHGETFSITARVLAAGKAAQGKKQAQLRPAEKDMTGMLNYRQFATVATRTRKVESGKSCVLRFAGRNSVKIIPLSSGNARVRVRIIWNISGKKPWKKTLTFKRGTTAMIGGPPAAEGGTYLLSLSLS